MKDQPNGVPLFSGVLLALVDHVLDEEQPPPTSCLQAGQLQLEVGGVGDDVLDPSAESLISRRVPARSQHDDIDRQVCPVVVAVLDGIHRRLRRGGLEALQLVGGEPTVGNDLGDLRQRRSRSLPGSLATENREAPLRPPGSAVRACGASLEAPRG